MQNGIKAAVLVFISQYELRLTIFTGMGWLEGLPGHVAHGCLLSMPFRRELALKFLDEYWGYLQFHSTVDTLKSAQTTIHLH